MALALQPRNAARRGPGADAKETLVNEEPEITPSGSMPGEQLSDVRTTRIQHYRMSRNKRRQPVAYDVLIFTSFPDPLFTFHISRRFTLSIVPVDGLFSNIHYNATSLYGGSGTETKDAIPPRTYFRRALSCYIGPL